MVLVWMLHVLRGRRWCFRRHYRGWEARLLLLCMCGGTSCGGGDTRVGKSSENFWGRKSIWMLVSWAVFSLPLSLDARVLGNRKLS